MELRDWISAEHEGVLTRFDRSIVDVVPEERWRERAGVGGSSIAFLLFHTAYHADLATSSVLGGSEALIATWRDSLGLGAFPAHAGLAEAEDPALTTALDLDAARAYAVTVHEAISRWLSGADLAALDTVPDSAAALAAAGVTPDAVPWLYTMWHDKPAAFFLQWEAIGHRVNHVGEMISVRNRLGLSPF
jgi:hypothetical protein